MEKDRFFDKLYEGKMTRREMHRGLAAVGLAMVTMPVWQRSAGAQSGNVPMVFEWGGYEDPALFGDYLAKYGEPPEYQFFADEEEGLAKIRGGFDPDIAHPCADNMRRWVDHGVIATIDTSRLSNWPDIFPALQTFDGVVIDGNVVMLPLDWGNSSVIYRTDLAGEYVDNESWAILFDEKYEGRLSMYDSTSAVIVAGLVLGYGNDVWAMSDEQLAEVRKLLEKQVKLVRFYWSSQTEAENAIASGEVVAAYAWNDAYVRLKAEGIPVKYMKPKEGILTWLCGLSILNSGDGDEQMMYDYLDAWASRETGRYVISEYGYGHANREAFKLVDPVTLDNLGFGSDPAAMLADGYIFQLIPAEHNEKYTRMFEEVKALSGL